MQAFNYPTYYQLDYNGQDERVKQLFERKNQSGKYVKSRVLSNYGMPYYEKRRLTFLQLMKNKKNEWRIINKASKPIMYQISSSYSYPD